MIWLAVAAGLAVVGGAIWLAARATRNRDREAARDELKQLKTKAVAINEQLDAAFLRHQQLATKQTRYAFPFRGTSKETYAAIAAAIEESRGKWLHLMEAWEKAEDLLDEEKKWSVQSRHQFDNLMKEASAESLAASIEQHVLEPLEQFETGPKRFDELLSNTGTSMQKLVAQLTALAERELANESFEADRNALHEAIANAEAAFAFDPLGAIESVEESAQSINQLGARTEAVLHFADEVAGLDQDIANFEASITEKQSAGWKFVEASANPDGFASRAKTERDSARKLLELGDPDAAAEHLDRADEILAAGTECLAKVESLRASAAEEISNREGRLAELREMKTQADAARLSLSNHHADEAWADAGDPQSAAELLTKLDSLLGEVRLAVSAAEQRYFSALESLARFDELSEECGESLSKIINRLAALEETKREAEAALRQLSDHATRVKSLLDDSEKDRAAANRQFHLAQTRLEELQNLAAALKPNWPLLLEDSTTVDNELSNAEEFARADFRLAEQASRAISKAEREIRKQRGFYRTGIAADLDEAESIVATAKAELAARSYESAIETATRAVEAAHRARHDATEKSQKRQIELERERQSRVSQQLGEIIPGPIPGTPAVIGAKKVLPGGTSRRRKRYQSTWD